MINEQDFSAHLDNMEALVKTLSAEVKKGRRMIETVKVQKVSDVAMSAIKNRIAFEKRLKKYNEK